MTQYTAPLSFAQQRLWFLDQLMSGSAFYNVPHVVRLAGVVDVAVLERAVSQIAVRHEVLRTRFVSVDGEPRQVIGVPVPVPVPVADVSGQADPEAAARELVAAEAARPFDLSAGPLLRVLLVRLGAGDQVLCVVMHHIVSDGWSLGVFRRELNALYGAFLAGWPSPLPPLPVQYADFAAWQRGWLAGDVLAGQVAYWRQQLAGMPHALELPADRPRPAVASYAGAAAGFTVPAEVAQALRGLSREHGVTLFMTLLAGFCGLLSRWACTGDVTVGTPIAGRVRPELETLIGFFVNTLVMRTDCSGDPAFTELLARVRETALGAYANQDLPFEQLVEELRPERDLSRNPLVQVTFQLIYAPDEAVSLGGAQVRPGGGAGIHMARFDLECFLSVHGAGGLAGYFAYSADLFDRETVERLLGGFQRVLAAAARAPRRRVSGIDLLGERERELVVRQWNDTAAPVAAGTVPGLFEARAAAAPDAVAVSCGGQWLTNAGLDARASGLARRLRELGAGPESVVAVLMERGTGLVAALLGVLKAGAAYLPVDPAYPQARITFMLADAGPVAVVADRAGAGLAPGGIPVLAGAAADPALTGGLPPSAAIVPGQLAYVIYTSGSTGTPKGVLVTHGAVLNFLAGMARWFGLGSGDRLLAVTTVSFDIHVLELYLPLLAGASVVVADRDAVRDPVLLGGLMGRSEATIMQGTPALWQALVSCGQGRAVAGVRVLAGGEALPPVLARQLRAAGAEVTNLYGPTEATVWATAASADGGGAGAEPIGSPIANTRVYVLDPWGEPVPVGVTGELFIGGEGLARGYHRRPGLTGERFVPDPFGPAGGRLYRTGDLARWRPGGVLEFAGRADDQVKIRGFRVEPGEIEAVLGSHPQVARAAVVAREDSPGDRRLTAYLVPDAAAGGPKAGPGSAGYQVLVSAVRELARQRLPEYMVPAAFVVLGELPLTVTGKVDRRALPAPDSARPGWLAEPAEPRTPAETAIAEIWAEVLGVDRVGIHDGFFDLGGHSLLATQVVSRIRDRLGAELPLRAVFEDRTVAGLAAVIRDLAGQGITTPPLCPAPRQAAGMALSFAQQRLWFLDQLMSGSAFYNVPHVVRLAGVVDVAVLERAVSQIAVRHEVLRTRFVSVDGEPRQVIGVPVPVPVPVADVSGQADPEAAARELVAAEAARPFDLSAGPLLRVLLVRLGAGDQVLCVVMHHIVSDGWSLGVFRRELNALYGAFLAGWPSPLPPLPVQYADFAAWQRGWLAGDVLAGQVAYWRQQLAGMPHALELPADRPRPAVASYAGAAAGFTVPAEVAQALRGLSREHGVTLFMTLLAGFCGLLSRWACTGDVTVGTPIAGRVRPELETLIGFFVNTLVMRTDCSGDPAFTELLARVRETALGAYANQDLPFEQLVEELRPERDLSRNPLVQVTFQLIYAPDEAVSLGGAQVRPGGGAGIHMARFDLECFLSVHGAGGLAGYFAYSADLFDRETVERLLGGFQRVLAAAARAPRRRVSGIDLLGERERELVVRQWNDTAAPVAAGTVPGLFEARAAAAPDAVAVSCGGQWLTNAGLDARASGLARRLRELGAGPESVVAVLMERGTGLVAALLGVLKAGAAYLPVDPAYPQARITFMLADAGPVAVVADRAGAGLAPGGIPVLAGAAADPALTGGLPPSAAIVPGQLAYVIYTSGSTGTPKGVLVTHASVVNRLAWMWRAYPFAAGEVAYHTASFGFVDSVWQLFGPLLAGVPVALAVGDELRDPRLLAGKLAERAVTRAVMVPSLLRAVLQVVDRDGLRLRPGWWTASGEELSAQLAERFGSLLPGAVLLNLYGSTEVMADGTAFACRPGTAGPVPIGSPIANTRVYVLDPWGEPVPVGVTGELFIGGEGLARGYHRRPGLTGERFVPDPFGPAGGRLYRTGDLARWRPGGVLEFAGRADDQVKIRGFRVEPGEIEAVLGSHPQVARAAVVAREDSPGDRRLTAYLVPDAAAGGPKAGPGSAGYQVLVSAVRELARQRLPEYMVPAAFVVLGELPLTVTGKVDRRALPAPDSARPGWLAEPAEPRTPAETAIAEIWAEVLGVDRVGIHDGFFDLGGHSLLATQVVSRIRDRLGAELPLRAVFEDRTVAGLAAVIRDLAGQGITTPPLCPAPRQAAGMALSFAQQRLWFLDQLMSGSAFYNVPHVVRLAGVVDVAVLERAVSQIAVRHEVLRTRFVSVDGEPRQVIGVPVPVPVPVADVSGQADPEAAARELVAAEAARPFDLSAGPLLRVLLVRLGAGDQVLCVVMHHIVSDGWSLGVFRRELNALYGAFLAGWPSPLPPLPVQYADFAAWQRGWLAGDVLAGQVAYWRQQLAGMPHALELPADRPRPAVASYAGAAAGFTVPAEVAQALRGLSREHGVTLFMTLLAGFCGLLSRWACTGDVTVGTPIAGRVRPELETLIGFFVNTLVMRTDCSGDPAFTELLARVRETALGAYANQDLPFEQLVEELRPERDLSRNPLVQVTFQLMHAPGEPLDLPGAQARGYAPGSSPTRFDLACLGLEDGGRLRVHVSYSADLFDRETVERLLGGFQRVLAAAARAPRRRVSGIDLLGERERELVVRQWNDTAAPVAAGTVPGLFEARAAAAPDAVAVSCGGQWLTYAGLDARASGLARRLRELGAGPESVVAVCARRSAVMIVAVLGVLKSGAAYLPVDPGLPATRLEFLLAASAASVVVTCGDVPGAAAGLPRVALGPACELAGDSAPRPGPQARPGNLAYVIYTSGSTGTPKGVAVPHRNIINLASALRARHLRPGPARPVVAAVASFSFDAFAKSIVLGPLCGGRLAVVPEAELAGPALARRLVADGCDLLSCTPSLLRTLAAGDLPRLSTLIVGGERCPEGLLEEWAVPGRRMFNVYGPTETTVNATITEVVGGQEPVPIGSPIANTRVYVLDPWGEPVPVGVTGELFIGGEGLARGYHRRPGLTGERFVPDPFGPAGGRLYRTGDLARWRPGGVLEFAGRADDQVKIRGFRVEPGEIEAVLGSHPQVARAAVVAREDSPGDRRLTAYLVPDAAAGGPKAGPGSAGYQVLVSAVRELARQRLPEYMVPAAFVVLGELPLTVTGKVDRRALPAPDSARPGWLAEPVEPRTPAETAIAEIWAEVLGVDRVGIHDGFFELGGHSLLVIRVISRIRDRLGVELPLMTLFRSPTVAGLAAAIETNDPQSTD